MTDERPGDLARAHRTEGHQMEVLSVPMARSIRRRADCPTARTSRRSWIRYAVRTHEQWSDIISKQLYCKAIEIEIVNKSMSFFAFKFKNTVLVRILLSSSID